eukprot:TRINITY_DN11312_c0_g1_i1.p1 TRINITY_DN11312_c0_g1~~TRINITY_DN11312_c0_g1_i1.p1  ORF type:complete len:385 (+),score=47.54 TRINITY_DN11312_c0_g1_i1:35-1156(+)
MEIGIGKPAQVLNVLIDTGSSNTLIPVPRCSRCGIGPFFDPSKSTTNTPMGCKSAECEKCVPDGYSQKQCVFGPPACAKETNACGFGVTYGGGSSALYGSYFEDILCMGTQCGRAQIGGVLDQYFFEGNYNSTQAFFGILGLAYPFNACNPTCTTPVYQSLSKETGTPNIVGMCLTGTQGGVMDLGFIDDKKFSGELQWAPVRTKRWYDIELIDIKINDTSVGFRKFMFETTNDVIGTFVDSGTSIILTSPATFNRITEIFQQKFASLPGVKGNNGFFKPGGVNPCITDSEMNGKANQFPHLHFVVVGDKGQNITLSTSPQQYLMHVDGSYCLGIAGTTGVGNVLGDVFMESYYIVFDREQDRLGFAPVASCQ